MVREGLRRSARASASAHSTPHPVLSDDSDLELLQASDSEDDYVGEGASSEGGEEVEEEDEGSPPSADEDDDEDVVNVRETKRKRAPAPPKPRPTKTKTIRSTAPKEPGRRSTAAARSNSTLNAFPEAYRDLLLNSGLSLARKPDVEKAIQPSFKVPPFPPGTVTPFISSLAHSPGLAVGQVEVREDNPHGPHRREHTKEIAKRVAVIAPWDGWEGEGWWPEMARGDGEDHGPYPGWKWRSQVRLGIDDLGRYTATDVLPASEGEKYLPKGGKVVLDVYDGQETARYEMDQFDNVPIENTISKGFAFSAGAPAWSVDWCPYPDHLAEAHGFQGYLAVSTIAAETEPRAGSRCDPALPGSIQIWSVPHVDDETLPSVTPGAKCEIVLCVSGGPVSQLKWMPMGGWDGEGDMPKLGIIAAVQLDGSTSLYAVPQPESLRASLNNPDGPVYLRAKPLTTFKAADSASTCVAWLSGRRIAVGLSNGHVAIYDAVDAMRNQPLPCMYLTLGLSAMRSISPGRIPPTNSDGQLDYAGEAVYLAFGSYDGTTGVIDLRDPSTVVELNRSRLPCMATAWSPQVGVPLYADVDYMVLLTQLRTNTGPATYYLTPHRGPVWDIGTSDYHTMVASAGSDGALLLANCGMGFYRRKQGGMLFQRLYEMDYDEKEGSYRMTHDFMAEATGLEEATSKANHKNTRTKGSRAEAQAPTKGDPAVVKTGAWRRNVGLHSVAWQSGAGLARAGWVASAGWSGVVRVENVRGKWLYQPK